jgi:hypothetical protein
LPYPWPLRLRSGCRYSYLALHHCRICSRHTPSLRPFMHLLFIMMCLVLPTLMFISGHLLHHMAQSLLDMPLLNHAKNRLLLLFCLELLLSVSQELNSVLALLLGDFGLDVLAFLDKNPGSTLARSSSSNWISSSISSLS